MDAPATPAAPADVKPKVDPKDRIIGQLENQRNQALTQSALHGAELQATAEALKDAEHEKAMLQLHAQVDKNRIAELEAKVKELTPETEQEAAVDKADPQLALVPTGTGE
jgi:predicted nuclease with TOPRIM domain